MITFYGPVTLQVLEIIQERITAKGKRRKLLLSFGLLLLYLKQKYPKACFLNIFDLIHALMYLIPRHC